MSREIITEFSIPAPPEKVWRVLADTAAYPEWNPLIRRLRHRGPLVSGSRAFISFAPSPDAPAITLPIRIRCVDHNRELSWHGGMRGLIRGFHYHRLLALQAPGEANTTTRVHHGEVFTGALTPLLWRALEPTLRGGYERFNQALIARVEALDRTPE